ncbi:MAG: acetyl-CoA carboxylase biotin carboxyl carrier protein subunit [Nitrososphaeraceae archaeon]|nr:acetyl-CoA carboxylase biotin carboxyl carrier protein subunit [Nitrososphaeraceae archaeon]
MDFKLDSLDNVLSARIIRNMGSEIFLLEIDNKEYTLRLLKGNSNEFEFILDNTFFHVKIIDNKETSIKLLINDQFVILKKHSILTDIIEKSIKSGLLLDESKIISSPIPGRVIKVNVSIGDKVQKGDSIVILESMKMQVGIKTQGEGIIKEIKVSEMDTVSRHDTIAVLE